MLLTQVPAYYRARRESLMRDHPGAVFLLPSNEELIRNGDVYHSYRQDSSFYYLTGWDEPESFLVLAGGKTTLFVRKRDPEREIWDGERYGVEGARDVFGVDEACLIHDLPERLGALLAGAERIFYRLGLHEAMDRKVLAALESLRRTQARSGRPHPQLADPEEILAERRLFKSSEEAALLREACRISAETHRQAMRETRPGMNEYEVEALINYGFRRQGCQRLGYDSIVAGGVNTTCLHYHRNDQGLRDGDLLLIDAGGEYGYYTSDITRTFPVGRRFSEPQARIYDLVLKAQLACIAMAKPGTTLPAIHRKACEVLTEGMLELGLLTGTVEECMRSGAYRRFYPHGTGHWLGMDVHDLGQSMKNGEPRKLEAGMCFTIEPGFYIQPGDQDAPAEYRGIGVRIEDDILVTPDGCEILTSGVPKERAEIEALRSEYK